MKHKHSVDELKAAVLCSESYRQVLIMLGIVHQGGNYATLKKRIIQHNIDTSHFLSKSHRRGKTFTSKRPIEEYLNNNFPIQSHTLKLRLIKEGYFSHQCYMCTNTSWLGGPIPLELDHIDGNHNNNNLSNLRILCPNCHSLTPTYRGRNIRGA